MHDQDATVADKPSALKSGSRPSAAASKASAVAVAGQQALRVDEVARARNMASLFVLLTLTAAVWFTMLGGAPWLRNSAIGACLVFGGVCTVVWRRARPDDNYQRLYRWFSGTAVVASAVIMYYIGIFSPAPVAVMLGISFFGTSFDRRWAIGCCAAASLIYAATAIGISTGVVPDIGVIAAPQTYVGQAFAIMMVPIVFFGALASALLSRRTATDAMAQVEEAARQVQLREAQLAEANLDLEKALEVGAGAVGRHTGRSAGKWLLGDVIGRGAMGEVYRATQGTSRAAVKTLVAHRDRDQLARFQRETDIARGLRSSGLVTVFDAGILDGEYPYLVMELLEGHDLAWHLRKTKYLPVDETETLCAQIADGLGTAHAAGIIHRDLKPQNLMRHEAGPAPQWKLLDFGVSKIGDSQGTLTQNLVVGTPGYMSPEQAQGKTVDARSDLFSFGAVLYRALTGQPPFRGNDTPQILFDVCYRGPKKPTELAPHLTADLDLFLAIAIAKRPDDRFASVTELAAAFRLATQTKLPAEIRARGEIILLDLPWGGRLRS